MTSDNELIDFFLVKIGYPKYIGGNFVLFNSKFLKCNNCIRNAPITLKLESVLR